MISKKVVLKFPKHLVEQPIIHRVVRDYDLVFNILRAKITSEEGMLVIELSGERCEEGISTLKRLGVSVQPLEKDILRDEKRCTHCSACVVHCPTGALHIKDRKTMRVEFDKSKCVLCEACVAICPVKAMSVVF